MKSITPLLSIAVIILLAWWAWVEGGRNGGAMAGCVAGEMKALSAYMTDKAVIERISISSCSGSNNNDVVKVPRGEEDS